MARRGCATSPPDGQMVSSGEKPWSGIVKEGVGWFVDIFYLSLLLLVVVSWV